MGYKAHKEKAEEKEKRLKRALLSIVALFLLSLLIFAAIVPPETWKYHVALPNVEKREEGALRIHFIDVGQGDCTLMELPDGKTVMIDGGNDTPAAKKQILRYLNALDIDVIDYLILTHAHADHCGGIEEIVRWKTVLNAYLPAASKATDTEYAEAYAALAESDCTLLDASRLQSFGLSDANYKLAFLYPYEESEFESNNDVSSVLWLDYLGVNALFMGDAPQEIETLLMRDDKLGFLEGMGVDLSSIEILKVAHHGSGSSSSTSFLEYLNVQKAVVSCGKNNPYGHPSNRVMDDLQDVGATVYRTDKDGHVVITILSDQTTQVATIKE